MAAARLVMIKFGSNYRCCLEMSKMEVRLLAGYVDDVRQGGTAIRYGIRYSAIRMEWSWTEDAWNEDKKLQADGESANARMKRICLPALNSINPDLRFTAEIPEEFQNQRLPTLDFELWLENNKLRHHYYQKPMRTPFTVMKRSAMAQQQRFSILSNEGIRRMNKTEWTHCKQQELEAVLNQYTLELKQSEYPREEVREIISCSIKGWKNKTKRRLTTGNKKIYRSAASTLVTRCRKKLTEKTSWYKRKHARDGKEEDAGGMEGMIGAEKNGDKMRWKHKDGKVQQKEKKIKACLYHLPHTVSLLSA